jgi:hypothetical protein
MALSAEGQLLALLDGLDDWRIAMHRVACVMSFRYLSKQEGDCGGNRPLVEPNSHWMVMERLLELPEPGFWLLSVMVCALARSDAGIATCRWALSTKVVVRDDPFHWTTAPGRNPVPVIVRNRLPLPAVMVL